MPSKKKSAITKPKMTQAKTNDDFIRYDYTTAPWAPQLSGSKVSFTLTLDGERRTPSLPVSRRLLWCAWAAFSLLCYVALVAAVIA
jgi:hypothetical protein